MDAAAGWVEVAPDIFHRRYEPVDVSVVAIVGPTGVTIVDTRNNPAEGAEILADAAAAFAMPVVAAINTHAHYDHTFGNQVFTAAGIPVFGHARIPSHYARFEAPRLARVLASPDTEPDKAWAEVVLTVPTVLVGPSAPVTALEAVTPLAVAPSTSVGPTGAMESTASTEPTGSAGPADPGVAASASASSGRAKRVVLGGRAVELHALAPGHTDTDVAVHIPDAATWLLGDVIEQSGAPMFGSGAYPLTWGASLAALLALIGPDDVLVPGHGTPVTRAFAAHQAALLSDVTTLIRTTHPTGTAADAVDLPPALTALWPDWMLRSALTTGYAQLRCTLV